MEPIKLMGRELGIPRVTLKEPNTKGYVLLAAAVDRRPALLPSSLAKRKLLAQIKRCLLTLNEEAGIEQASLFDAILFAPGNGKRVLEEAVRKGEVQPARFDVAVLITTRTPEDAKSLLRNSLATETGASVVPRSMVDRAGPCQIMREPSYRELSALVHNASGHVYEVAAENVRRIDEVAEDGVFLFNFFYAENPGDLIPIWEYTAGWFTAKTGLRDSTVLRPLAPSGYGIVNHASWPNLRTFLPHLILRPTFRSYVLANFEANGIAAQPIIYRRIWKAKATARALSYKETTRDLAASC